MSTILTTTAKVKIDRKVRETVERPIGNDSWEITKTLSRSYEVIGIPGRMTMIRRENMN